MAVLEAVHRPGEGRKGRPLKSPANIRQDIYGVNLIGSDKSNPKTPDNMKLHITHLPGSPKTDCLVLHIRKGINLNKLTLIITEKPSVAHAYAAVLGVKEKKDRYIAGNGYLISWCLGHLEEFAPPEYYDDKHSVWRKEDLPILPGKSWKYLITKPKQAQFKILKGLMEREDVSAIVNACDAGREGELIFRNLYNMLGCKKPMKRLWLSSMEEDAIREGFNNLHDGAEYDGLYKAAFCRAQADWLVGMNATRLFSVLYHRTLNVGRVISPTLAMLVQREAEIGSFKSTPFFSVELAIESGTAVSERIDDRSAAETLSAGCTGMTAMVKSVERKERSEKAPTLYDLTTLQREANRLLGYTAQQTLDYLQSLYEKKLCTYPRTDSRYLTDNMQSVIPGLVSISGTLCEVTAPKDICTKQVCNSEKVTDHHAVILTAAAGIEDISALPAGERNILQLVALGLLRAVSGDYRYEETTVTLVCGGTEFTMKGRQLLSVGWQQYGRLQKHNELPDFAPGQVIPVLDTSVREGKTTPPKRYTEDTLLADMENAGSKDMPEDAERKGIGTPATRAAMLEKLIAAGFVARKKEKKTVQLIPSQTAVSLISVLPEQLRSPLLTAEWEQRLKMVERDKLSPAVFIGEIEQMLRELVYTAEALPGAETLFPSDRPVVGKCPRCGSAVTESRKGDGFFCESNTCRFALWKDNRYLTAKRITLTRDMVKGLLDEGQVMIRGMYSSKTDTTYDAMLVLADDGQRMRYRVSFDYAE